MISRVTNLPSERLPIVPQLLLGKRLCSFSDGENECFHNSRDRKEAAGQFLRLKKRVVHFPTQEVRYDQLCCQQLKKKT